MILLTGATGFVGREVLTALITLGQPVRLLVRRPDRRKDLAGPQVEIVPGDLLQPESLAAACRGVDTVIHLVGIIAETRQVSFPQAHVEATQHLLAAARAAGVKRFIHMSALGTRSEARSEYHGTKWAAEELVRSSGLAWTIFRPSLIYGYDQRDRLFNLLHRLVSFPLNNLFLHSIAVLNGGEMKVQPVSVRDVAHAFAQAVLKPESISQTYALTGPEPVRFRELVEQVIAVTGQKMVYENWPVRLFGRGLLWVGLLLAGIGLLVDHEQVGWLGLFFLLLVWAALWRRMIIFNIPTSLIWPVAHLLDRVAPRWLRFSQQLLMLEEDNVADPAPAARTFGYQPETLSEALKKLF